MLTIKDRQASNHGLNDILGSSTACSFRISPEQAADLPDLWEEDREFLNQIYLNHAVNRFTSEQIAEVWMMTCKEAAFNTNNVRRQAFFEALARVSLRNGEHTHDKIKKVYHY